jgi:Flp pilus assembly protein TadD
VEDHYRKGEYAEALALAHQINMPNYWWTHMDFAMIYGQLGRVEEARAAAERLRELYPGFTTRARTVLGKWYYSDDLVERFIDGLRKAGLDVPEEPPPAD